MAIEDYLPNIFGGAPTMYQGLLNPKDQAALERRANLGGLLGAGAALAQGMSPQGFRRSPLQNILTALAAGYAGAGQTYESGLTQMANVQKLQQSQAQIQAINQLLQDPRVANDPMMVAYIRANPAEAIKYFAEMAPLQQALAGTAPVPAVSTQPAPAVPSAAPAVATTTDGAALVAEALPAVTVQGSPIVKLEDQKSGLMNRINELRGVNQRISGLPTKQATDIRAANNSEITNLQNQIKLIDEQIGKVSVSGYDFEPIIGSVPEMYKGRVKALQKAVENGTVTSEQLATRLDAILNDANQYAVKQADFTNENRSLFGSMFKNADGTPKPMELATVDELRGFVAEKQKREKELRIAGRTIIDMGTREMEKEFAKGVVEDTRASFQQAKSAVNTLKAINTLKPILSAGVYEGVFAGAPRAIDQFATALGVTGKDRQEKLQRTAVAMQKLASLELSAAEAMKGQGAITENERSLIARAAGGNLRDFTATEVQALLGALETVAQQKITSHQQNYEIMSKDPVGRKYSKYYNIEAPVAPVKKYNPATGRIE